MSYSIELKVKYLKKIKFLIIMFISPIILLIARSNNFSILQTIVVLSLNILVWTEVFHQLLVMFFRNYLVNNDNGEYLSNKFVNALRQLFYLLFILIIYIVSITDSFSISTSLWMFIIGLLLYKFTPKPIMVSHHFFMCNNQIYIIDGFKEFTSLGKTKINCKLIEGDEIIIKVSNKYKEVFLEKLQNMLYIKEREMEHLVYDKKIVISLIKRLINYVVVFLFLILLSMPIVIELVFPIFNNEIESEYFMNITFALFILAGIINGYITRFIITPIKINEFIRYKHLNYKPLQVLLVVCLLILAYYHIYKIHDFILFFITDLVLLIYWISSMISYVYVTRKLIYKFKEEF